MSKKQRLMKKTKTRVTKNGTLVLFATILVLSVITSFSILHKNYTTSLAYVAQPKEYATVGANVSYKTTTKGEVVKSSIIGALYDSNGKSRVNRPGVNTSYGAENVWKDIIDKGVELMKKNNYKEHLVVFEVGAQRAKQTIDAAKAQFHAYCIEPSPKSFDAIYRQMTTELKKYSSLGKFMHLYNVAAGSKSDEEVEFRTTGGTGDHVGEFDMWNMKPGQPPADWPKEKIGTIVKVPSLRLDDIIYYNKVKPNVLKGLESGSNPPKIDDVWAIKVDTQGFEPHVFAGLTESIEQNKIKYVLTEFWPNGMGLLNNRPDKCNLGVEMLTTLISAGYTLYALPTSAHPYTRSTEVDDEIRVWKRNRALHDLKADCECFLNLEKKFSKEGYHMGFWTDYLALAPDAKPIEPKAFGYV